MRSAWLRNLLLPTVVSLFFAANVFAKSAGLKIYFIDVEGGQSTLFVAPSGESLLVDTGWPDANGRDADRITEAMKNAGVKHIDYLLITHYHTDHVGGVPQLLERVKVESFIDHGPNKENDELAPEGYAAYLKSIGNAKRIIAKPGYQVSIPGISVQIVSAAGELITQPLSGAGQTNPYCASEGKWPADYTENAASVGFLLQYGNFRLVDLGDLTKDKEVSLVCPNNLIGTVDVFLVSHHGMDMSNSKSLVDALHPKVAIMENAPKKGDSPQAWQTVHDSPGLQDLWQLHYTASSGTDHNAPEDFIANLDGHSDGHYLKVVAQPDGGFNVINTRNNFARNYKK